MLPVKKAPSNSEYWLVSDSASIEESNDLGVQYVRQKPRNRFPWKIIAILEFTIIVILGTIFLLSYSWQKNRPLLTVYTPAIDAIEYETRRFHSSVEGDRTVYQGPPSPEVDELWHDIYAYGVSQISKEQAELLPMRTSEIPGRPEKYITSLSVFHHLHCVNSLRKSLYPDHYPDMDPAYSSTLEHLNHCVDILRQALTCSPDVSPLVWQWNEEKNRSTTVLRVPHTCMNWDKIHAWAVENAAEQYDSSIRMEGNPIFQADL